MKSETNDIYEMLDTLSLPVAAQRFVELSESPELGSYTTLQFIREVHHMIVRKLCMHGKDRRRYGNALMPHH